jgi:hypothetical protein
MSNCPIPPIQKSHFPHPKVEAYTCRAPDVTDVGRNSAAPASMALGQNRFIGLI